MDYKLLMVLAVIFSTDAFSFSNSNNSVTPKKSQQPRSWKVLHGRCENLVGRISINFRGAGLQRIGSDFACNENVTCISFENNEIVEVSSEAFLRMPNLRFLNLAQNRLSFANFSGLNGHLHLQTLIVDENDSDNVEFMMENKFPQLMYLYLRSNGLQKIQSLAFAPRLTHLYLSSNELSDLSFLEDVASSLIILDLTDNKIKTFNVTNFPILRELRLDGNLIKQLCSKSCRESALILQNVPSLRQLSISRNGLVSVEPDAFDETSHLLNLNLSSNKIETIRKNTFERTDMLTNLSLNDNLLKQMPDLCGPESLQYLWLADNQLTALDNDSFCLIEKFRFIDLSNNEIESVEAGTFIKQYVLEILKLSNNRITHFPALWMYRLTSLRILYVDGNRLTKLKDLALDTVSAYAKLESVYLQNNLITNIHTKYVYNLFRNVPNIKLQLIDNNQLNNSYHKSNSELCKCNCTEANEIELN